MDHDGGECAYVTTTIVTTWPKGSFAENLAVGSDGAIFVTLHTDRSVVRVDPRTGDVALFATFDTPVAGLVILADGDLAVSGGSPGCAPGVIWRVAPDGRVSRAADLPDAAFLNGVTIHPDGRILVADSLRGRIYAVDTASGAVGTWLSDSRLVSTGGVSPGANGVKLFGGFAYVTVTGTATIVRAPIRPDGAAGPLEIVAERLRGDDFAIGADGSLFIATHPACSLVRLAPDGARTTLAGADQGLTGATAVAFGRTDRDRRAAYVTTTGGAMTLPDDQVELAKLVRVDVGVEAAS